MSKLKVINNGKTVICKLSELEPKECFRRGGEKGEILMVVEDDFIKDDGHVPFINFKTTKIDRLSKNINIVKVDAKLVVE